MSVSRGKEFIPFSEEASDKEKPEKKMDNSDLRTNVSKKNGVLVRILTDKG